MENRRWVGFLLGVIVALSLFFVAMEYTSTGDGDDSSAMPLHDLTLQDMDMLPAIDQQALAQEKDERKPTLEDMLNLKRRDIPNKVMPHDAGSMNGDERKTAAPQVRDVPIVTQEAAALPDPPKVKEDAKKETEKMTDDSSEEEVERYDDKVSKRILSETPTPPGGWVEFMKWLTKTLHYPAAAKDARHQGTVSITFLVNIDGSVSDVRVKDGKSPELNEEALRVLSTMGRWKPGIDRNRPCRSLVEIPIVFRL